MTEKHWNIEGTEVPVEVPDESAERHNRDYATVVLVCAIVACIVILVIVNLSR